ncbi:hypothetical protein [Sphingomicrobium flavum]|uniref:hypothetical protein n=1 Tax=Sphingomicrobium flavum TaxID=1229164 RepID=UPI0021ADF33B|nr:hypothetical protein [Sphingomicrobium flavum]
MMIKDWVAWSVNTYRYAGIFCIGAFWLVLLPVATEAFQHVVEYRLGMFDPDDGVSAGAETNIRLAAGIVKALSIVGIALILPRYFLFERDLAKAFAFSPRARSALWKMVATFVVLFAFIFFVAPILIDLFVAPNVQINARILPFVPLIMGIAIFMPIQARYVGIVAAIFDQPAMTGKERRTFNHLLNTRLPLTAITTFLPIVALHYWLNISAIGQDGALLFIILAADSLLVGFLATILGALTYIPYVQTKKSS